LLFTDAQRGVEDLEPWVLAGDKILNDSLSAESFDAQFDGYSPGGFDDEDALMPLSHSPPRETPPFERYTPQLQHADQMQEAQRQEMEYKLQWQQQQAMLQYQQHYQQMQLLNEQKQQQMYNLSTQPQLNLAQYSGMFSTLL
jgi:hypothetical protein